MPTLRFAGGITDLTVGDGDICRRFQRLVLCGARVPTVCTVGYNYSARSAGSKPQARVDTSYHANHVILGKSRQITQTTSYRENHVISRKLVFRLGGFDDSLGS